MPRNSNLQNIKNEALAKLNLLNKFIDGRTDAAFRRKIFATERKDVATKLLNEINAINQIIPSNTSAPAKKLTKKIITKAKREIAEPQNTIIRLASNVGLPILHQVSLPNSFKYLEKNKFNISIHTFSYNLPDDFNFIEFLIKQNVLDIVKADIDIFINRCIEKLYNKLISYVKNGSYFRILMDSRHNGVVSTKIIENLTDFPIEEFIKRFLSTYEMEDLFTANFTIHIIRNPSGGGMLENVPKFLIKRGISIVLNDDDICGQRCLALADAKNHNDLKNMKKLTKMWEKRAKSIAEEIKVTGRMVFTDFDAFAILRKKQVVILSSMFQQIYSTEIEFPEKVYIYYDSEIQHYHYIHDVNAATNDICRNSKWCKSCNKSFRFDTGAFSRHKCVGTACYFCKENFENIEEKEKHFQTKCWSQCAICNTACPNDNCKDKHEKICRGKNIKCNLCKKFIDKDHFPCHKCNEDFCTVCKIYYTGNHRCFISPLGKQDAVIGETWTYDFESRFDESLHVVNKCVCMKLFSDEIFICDTIGEFVNFALSKRNVTFIAHNGKAYDTWMVHKYLVANTNKRPNKLILAGNKIMYMKINSIRFVDSLNHIAQALASFPKTFGLKELKKGFFPYMFNVAENAKYVGKIPDKEYFKPDQMATEKRTEFFEWYEKQTDVLYDFAKELVEYCISDVQILKQSMEIYIKDGIELNGINPISSPTIASYAMKVFRTNFLEENKISILTKEEYNFCKRGFFGGRTEVFQLKAKAKDVENGKDIRYSDIQSLYPTVQFFDKLPCGVPNWDFEPVFESVEEYLKGHFGYIECDVVCPTEIHIPVLPEKKNGKLVFDLINKEKAVYSSVELLKAVECGYRITKIHSSLSFEQSDDLFKGYVQKFLKMKTESSGYDGDDVDNYIKRYYNHCGVLLDKEKIKSNKGMKLLAKILLNSLWGKFGQKDDMSTTEYFTKPDQWFRLLSKHLKGEVILKNETMVDENTLYVEYISNEVKNSSRNSTNLALAGFVTSQARLRLYKELHKLDNRVIYCDTDSIIYHYDKDAYNIREGEMLGEWEAETTSPIVEVLAVAPKSYGYKCLDGSGSIKCKGISLNYSNSKKYNFETLENLIRLENSESIKTNKLEFVKDKKRGEIRTKEDVEKLISFEPKKFKRIVNDDFTTNPIF